MQKRWMVFGVVTGMVGLAGCARDARRPPRAVAGEVGGPTPVVGPTAPPPTPAPPPPQAEDDALVGLYAMTLEISPECAAVPEAERTRRYAASIDRRTDGEHVVSLDDASFLQGRVCTIGPGRYAGMGCNQFFVSRDGETVRFSLTQYDDWHGGQIVEHLPSGGWLEITGSAEGAINGASIEARGPGNAWYCPIPDYPFPCSQATGCESQLRLTLTRQ